MKNPKKRRKNSNVLINSKRKIGKTLTPSPVSVLILKLKRILYLLEVLIE